jgi:hypothetical protein
MVTASPLAVVVDSVELASELAAVLSVEDAAVESEVVLLSPQAAMETTIAAAMHRLRTFFFIILNLLSCKLCTFTDLS